MKTKLIMVSLVFLISGFNAQAQLLKKLKNAVKGDNHTEQNKKQKDGQTTPAEIPGMKTIPAPPDNNVKLPESYPFSYRATLHIENSQGTAEPVFYIQPDAPYYARKQANDSLTEFLVLDNQLNVTVIFAELDGEKRRMHNRINLETKATLIGAYRDAPQKEPIKTLESKTILGYNCQGYQIATEAGITELWITDEAPASLFSTMFARRADEPGTPFSKNSMIMELDFTSANAPEQNYQMVCTGLQPETLVLSKSDYQEAL